MNCPKCQFEAPGDSRFCGRCGVPLSPPGKPFDPDRTETLAFTAGQLTEGSLFAGRYLVIDELGKGGMGCVYRVLDTKVDEEVALKFINPEVAADAKIIERFRGELKITRRITHRHVCRMYDLSTADDSLFITMEYIPGEDLGAMIHRLGKIPVERAFVIFRQVCEGLAEVHRLGIIHRDLKPKNIMISRDGEAKIMDFGLARTPHGVKLTTVGTVVGTPSFMSPEQINGETLDSRSDIFSLGVIMYSMLTGALPFDADTTLALALQHKTHRPPNPHSLNPRVSEELGKIVLRCLEVDKEKRYPNSQDLLADLDKAGEMFDTYDVHVPGRTRKGTVDKPARKTWVKVMAGAAIVLALALAGLSVRALLQRSHVTTKGSQIAQKIEPAPPAQTERAEKPETPAPAKPVVSVPVAFVTEPSRATIFVDEIEMGISDDTFILSPGPHTVRIRKPGYRDLTATLVAEPGGTAPLRKAFRLVPQPPALGTLGVTSEPSEADVFLNGSLTPAGKTPFVKELPAGKVHIAVRLAGYEEQAEDIDLSAGERSDISCPLTPQDGIVEISSEPEGADVYTGKDYVGRTPLKRTFKPGVYRLRISLKNWGEKKDVMTVNPGETLVPLKYTFQRPRTVAARYFLKVISDPAGAQVTINGVLQKDPTPFVWELDTQEVRIRVEKGGLASQEETVVLKPAPARNEKSYKLRNPG